MQEDSELHGVIGPIPFSDESTHTIVDFGAPYTPHVLRERRELLRPTKEDKGLVNEVGTKVVCETVSRPG